MRRNWFRTKQSQIRFGKEGGKFERESEIKDQINSACRRQKSAEG